MGFLCRVFECYLVRYLYPSLLFFLHKCFCHGICLHWRTAPHFGQGQLGCSRGSFPLFPEIFCSCSISVSIIIDSVVVSRDVVRLDEIYLGVIASSCSQLYILCCQPGHLENKFPLLFHLESAPSDVAVNIPTVRPFFSYIALIFQP